MRKTIFEVGTTVALKGTENYGEITKVSVDTASGEVFYYVDFFDDIASVTVTASALELAQKWRMRLDSLIEFSTPLGYTEEDAVTRFFEELSYIGEGLKHDYDIREVTM